MAFRPTTPGSGSTRGSRKWKADRTQQRLATGRRDATGLRRFTDRFFSGFDGTPVPAPIDLANHLVWGAVAYARELGFEPHPDFAAAARHLDPLTGPSAIGFGCDGTPHYVQGPYDDADHIMRTLRERVGVDNFHCTVEVPLQAV